MQDLTWEKKHYLDASAAVKLVVEESASELIRAYFRSHVNKGFEFYMTSLCFAEALGVLKVKYKYRNEIDREAYTGACGQLIALLAIEDIQLDELPLTELEVYLKTKQMVLTHDIDFLDAIQLITVKHGEWSPLVGESQSMLITADDDLAEAARNEGLRVWNILVEEEPT